MIQWSKDRTTGQAQARKAVQTLERGAKWFCLKLNPGRKETTWKNKILTLTDNTVKFVWEDKHPALILFSDKSNKNYDAYERMLKSVAEEIYGRITIINAGINENNEIHLLPIMSVDKTKLPAVRIIDTRDEYQRKIYELEGIINEKSIITFVNDWENERLKVMLKTENIPNDYEQ